MGDEAQDIKVANYAGGFCVQHATICLREKNPTIRKLNIVVRLIVWGWHKPDSCAHQILN
jgi:hypothetical protein